MKKIKMSLSTLITNIVIAVLVITAAVLLIVGHADSAALVKEYNKPSFILMLIAMVGFIALTNVSAIFKKVQMYILIPILVIYFTLSTIESLFILNIDLPVDDANISLLGTTNQTLGLAILALFIVSIIFTLKGKKWAVITTIVILSLNIYSTYSLVVLTNAALGVGDSTKIIFMLYGLGIMLIAEVVYFVSLLYPKTEKQVTEPVITEEAVNEESVNTEVVEPVAVSTEE